MESLENLKKERMETMEAADVRRLITQGKSRWSRGKRMSMRTDKIGANESDLFKGDEELIELLVLEGVVRDAIDERIDTILSAAREVPYQISDHGIMIRLEDYDQEKLKIGLGDAGLDFEPDYYNEVGYITPISKFKTSEGSLPEIKPILEHALILLED